MSASVGKERRWRMAGVEERGVVRTSCPIPSPASTAIRYVFPEPGISVLDPSIWSSWTFSFEAEARW